MANLDAYITEQTKEPFEPKPTPEPPTGGTAMSDMTNGIIEIKWLEGNTYNQVIIQKVNGQMQK